MIIPPRMARGSVRRTSLAQISLILALALAALIGVDGSPPRAAAQGRRVYAVWPHSDYYYNLLIALGFEMRTRGHERHAG